MLEHSEKYLYAYEKLEDIGEKIRKKMKKNISTKEIMDDIRE